MSDILSRLAPPQGARTSKKRLGRGPGSGLGKTSGRGQKGQKARSGGGPARGFEGGQMPVQRRLPKRGFKNPFRKVYAIVNLEMLDRFEDGATVGPEEMAAAGLLKKNAQGVKVLGKGDLKKKLLVKAHSVSASARQKIEESGGSFEELTE